jgi:hypothetical protein
MKYATDKKRGCIHQTQSSSKYLSLHQQSGNQSPRHNKIKVLLCVYPFQT